MHGSMQNVAPVINQAHPGGTLRLAFSAGAEQAGLSVASASARVRGMEEQAGAWLLERGQRGVELTPAGWTLLHHARLVTGQMERMRGELGEYARGLKGHVRLLANTAAAAEFLPEILAAFLAANPSVDVDLDASPSATRMVAAWADCLSTGFCGCHQCRASLPPATRPGPQVTISATTYWCRAGTLRGWAPLPATMPPRSSREAGTEKSTSSALRQRRPSRRSTRFGFIHRVSSVPLHWLRRSGACH
jgi:hypothetical protein